MTLGPQFEQLKMFMTPREIRDKYQPLEADWHMATAQLNGFEEEDEEGNQLPDADEYEVWDQKYDEAMYDKYVHGPYGEISLADSIEQEGVKHPALLGPYKSPGRTGKPQVVGGHHRIAAANDDSFIPVIHTSTTDLDVLRGLRSEVFRSEELSPWGGYK